MNFKTIIPVLFVLLIEFAALVTIQADTIDRSLPVKWSVFVTNFFVKSISEDPFGNHIFVGRSEVASTWSGFTSRLTALKLANDGTFVWSADIGNIEIDSGGNVATTTDNQGNIYIGTAVKINPSSHELIIAKLTQDGKEIWLARFKPVREGLYFVRSLRIAENGFVYVLFSNSFSHDDFAESYLASFDSEGSLRWSMKFDGSARAMETDKKTGEIILSGNTRHPYILRIDALGGSARFRKGPLPFSWAYGASRGWLGSDNRADNTHQ